MLFRSVRMAETLATYVTLYEHISSSTLMPITPSDLTTRVWDLINRKKAWKTSPKAITWRSSSDNSISMHPRGRRSHCVGSRRGINYPKNLEERGR